MNFDTAMHDAACNAWEDCLAKTSAALHKSLAEDKKFDPKEVHLALAKFPIPYMVEAVLSSMATTCLKVYGDALLGLPVTHEAAATIISLYQLLHFAKARGADVPEDILRTTGADCLHLVQRYYKGL